MLVVILFVSFATLCFAGDNFTFFQTLGASFFGALFAFIFNYILNKQNNTKENATKLFAFFIDLGMLTERIYNSKEILDKLINTNEIKSSSKHFQIYSLELHNDINNLNFISKSKHTKITYQLIIAIHNVAKDIHGMIYDLNNHIDRSTLYSNDDYYLKNLQDSFKWFLYFSEILRPLLAKLINDNFRKYVGIIKNYRIEEFEKKSRNFPQHRPRKKSGYEDIEKEALNIVKNYDDKK